jgi:hypothetical protein
MDIDLAITSITLEHNVDSNNALNSNTQAVLTCTVHVRPVQWCWGATLTLVATEKTSCRFDFTLNIHVHVQLLLTNVCMYVCLNGIYTHLLVRAR